MMIKATEMMVMVILTLFVSTRKMQQNLNFESSPCPREYLLQRVMLLPTKRTARRRRKSNLETMMRMKTSTVRRAANRVVGMVM